VTANRNLVPDESGSRFGWHTSARKMESIYGVDF